MKLFPQNKIKFIFFFLLLFLFSSCLKTSYWSNNYLISQNKKYDTASLIYKNPKNFIEVEFIQFDDKISCFLNVCSTEISQDSKHIPIFLKANSDTLQTYGYLREGNQKITLDEEAKNFLVSSLEKEQEVTIKVDEIEESINPEYFSKNYRKLLSYNSFYSKLVKSFY